ncbi:MAG: DUF3048 domain-containing protein [Actinomycetota bacterium]
MRVAWAIVVLGAVGVVALLVLPGPTSSPSTELGIGGVGEAPDPTAPVLLPSRRAGDLAGRALAAVTPTTVSPDPTTTTADAPAPSRPVLVPEPPSAPPLSDPELVELLYRGQLGRLDPDEEVVPPVADPPPALADDVAPLTGIASDPAVPERPALVVKIDNSVAARPQAGLIEADVVYEELVEGGTTRFAAVFHSTAAPVGPVRSFRSTDIGILGSLGEPMLSWSGANRVFAALLREQPVIDRGTSQAPYWRDRTRRAPHDLMTDVDSLRGELGGVAPAPLFAYRAPGTTAVGAVVEAFDVVAGSSTVTWRWNGAQWERWLGGTPHPTTVGPVITTDNVIVQRVPYLPSGLVDGAGSVVPEAAMVGTGTATILTGGVAIEATWTRPTLRSVTTFTDAGGEHIELTPGRTWVHLAVAG